jgi:hypothetical protein
MTTRYTVPELEARLLKLYALTGLTEAEFAVRDMLARAYHALTGRWFAARFVY